MRQLVVLVTHFSHRALSRPQAHRVVHKGLGERELSAWFEIVT